MPLVLTARGRSCGDGFDELRTGEGCRRALFSTREEGGARVDFGEDLRDAAVVEDAGTGAIVFTAGDHHAARDNDTACVGESWI